MPNYIGIDIAKLKFDVALLVGDKFKSKVFSNTNKGFTELMAWVHQQHVEPTDLHACMEATGNYGDALAEFLFDSGCKVSIVNPAQIKALGQSQLKRNKTDKTDAKLIAQFCFHFSPTPWQPSTRQVRVLQAMLKRLAALGDIRQQETNRLETAHDYVQPNIRQHIEFLDQAIKTLRQQIHDHIDSDPTLRAKKDLLLSIPGIGDTSAANLLAFIPSMDDFESAKKLVAWIGLNPRQHTSGSSVFKKTLLSKTGNSFLRKILYMPALVAMRHNSVMVVFAKRLKESGKRGKVVVCAVMRKLVHMIYGILKHKMPFNAELTAC